jgi:tol-pal system protein YbgF
MSTPSSPARLPYPALGGLVIACSALISLPALAAGAGDPVLEARVERLEKALGNQSASSLLLQLQRLQQEVQELRGLVELQQYKINALTGGQTPPPTAADQPLPPPIEDDTGADQPAGSAGAESGATAGPGVGSAFVPPVSKPISALDLRPVAPSRLPPLPSPETTAGGEREAYKTAFDLLKDRRYGEAQKAFRDLLARYPQGQYADNARYWLAESSYSNRDFPAALMEYEALVSQYPQSPKIAGALLKIGYIQFEQQNWPAARTALEAVVKRYPESTEARLAKSRLDRMVKDGH